MQATQNGDDQLIKDGEENDATQGERIYKDYSKPDGEACRDDGTLKDASEMEWPNSPSDSNPYNVNQSRRLGREHYLERKTTWRLG